MIQLHKLTTEQLAAARRMSKRRESDDLPTATAVYARMAIALTYGTGCRLSWDDLYAVLKCDEAVQAAIQNAILSELGQETL